MIKKLLAKRSALVMRRVLWTVASSAAPVLLGVGLVACERSPKTGVPQGVQVASTCPSASASASHLKLEKGGYLQDSASRHLQLAEEMPLWCGSPAQTAFRLL